MRRSNSDARATACECRSWVKLRSSVEGAGRSAFGSLGEVRLGEKTPAFRSSVFPGQPQRQTASQGSPGRPDGPPPVLAGSYHAAYPVDPAEEDGPGVGALRGVDFVERRRAGRRAIHANLAEFVIQRCDDGVAVGTDLLRHGLWRQGRRRPADQK